MTLTDIITLAKQGYKPADIKELIALADNVDNEQQADNQQEQVQSEGANSEDTAENQPTVDAKEQKPTEPPANNEQGINYKELYEKSQADLAKAQQFNTRQTVTQPNDKTDEELFSEVVKSFM